MIEAVGLRKQFQDFVAVKDISFTVDSGLVYVFLGPNGAGKTTTIRMLTGILASDAGELKIFGKTYKQARNEILNRIGYIPDRPFLYGKLSAMEMIRFMGSLRRLSPNHVKKRGRELLEQFKLVDFEEELIERFSHGMRQKLVMTLALLHDPDLLIVDEPMVGLDPRAALHMKQLLVSRARAGKTVFMSTHTLEVAAQLCDQVGIIHQGQLVANETLQSLTRRMEKNDGDLEAVFMALTEDQQAQKEGVPEP